MYGVHQPLEQIRIRLGHDAVAEVEDMAGPAVRGVEHIAHALVCGIPAGNWTGRIKVALDAFEKTDALPGFVEPEPPVHAHQVAARRRHQFEKGYVARAEVDGWGTERPQRVEDAPHPGLNRSS